MGHFKLDDEDVGRIAAEVVKQIAAAGGKVTTDKPAAADNKGPAKKAGKKAEGPKREDVLARVRAYGAATSKDKAKELIGKYAEAFADVPDDKLADLLADVDAAEAASPEEEDDL
jgi:hypothetical protein